MKTDSPISNGCDSCNPQWIREMTDMEHDYEAKSEGTADGSAAESSWPYHDFKIPKPISFRVQKDAIDPPHYKQGPVECIDAIKSALTPDEYRGYLKGTVFKYLWRERMKGGDESVKKAEWFLKRMTK